MRVVSRVGSGFLPNCIPQGIGDGNPSYYPKYGTPPSGIPLAKMMKWYWKVRDWTLLYEGSASGVPFSITQQSSTPNPPISPQPEPENKLVCQNGRNWIWGAGGGVSANMIYAALDGFSPAAYFPSPFTLYIPLLTFSTSGIGVTTLPDSGVVLGTFTIDGETCQLFSNVLVPPHLDYADVTLTPFDYYPYANSDGLEPIYDSSTGAELRDPFLYQDPLE